MRISRNQVYFVDIGPVRGNEMDFRHPVVVVSVNDVNYNPFVVVTVPGVEQDQHQATVERSRRDGCPWNITEARQACLPE